jgi:hypothetical protein
VWLRREFFAAAAVELLLRTVSLPKTCAALGVRFQPQRVDAPPKGLLPRSARHVALRVDDLYGCVPLPDTCLRRALVAGYLLRQLQPELVLGVRTTPHFEAHAWLCVAGGILDWSNRHAEFHRL